MKIDLDRIINSLRAVMRGEASGSMKFAVLFLLALCVWTGAAIARGRTSQAERALTVQQNRYHTLLALGEEYKSLAPSSGTPSGPVDVASVFAQVSERMQLGNRVNRITPDGANQSVEINRLYADELAELQRQLSSRGVRFISAELRALPSGSERLFSVNAIIGPVNS